MTQDILGSFYKLKMKNNIAIVFLGVIILLVPIHFLMNEPSIRALVFYLIYVIVVITLGLHINRNRDKIYRQRRVVLEQMVDERTAQLQEANVELETVMDELREANQIAMRERETAQKANRAKSEFLANMSHEIRTPMNAILGFSEIMEHEIKDEKFRRYLHAISSSGKTLMGLINDILDLSRIEAGKIDLEYAPVNPRSILNEIEHIFANKTIEKALDFILEIDPKLPEVLMLDGLRLRQVLLNLVGNAVKFTHKGFVKLSTEVITPPDESRPNTVDIRFSVQDTGIGVPDHQKKVIFEAFKQQEGQQSIKYGGTGLGLAITLKLVQLMNGGIDVLSEVNKGSTFQVTIREVKISSMEATQDADIHLDVEGIRFAPARIVVADDNELNRQLLIEFLNKSPIEWIEAKDGKEALELVRKHQPDLVLMDLKMPAMTGGEACRLIKTDDAIKHIPVIIVTAAALREQWPEIKEALGDSNLNKPVGKSDLIIELMHFLPYSVVESGSTGTVNESELHNSTERLASKLPMDRKENTLQLLEYIRQEGIIMRCNLLKNTLILDDIEEFLKEIKEVAKAYHSGMMFQWIQWLEESVQQFNLENIQQSLAAFPELIEDLTAATESGIDEKN